MTKDEILDEVKEISQVVSISIERLRRLIDEAKKDTSAQELISTMENAYSFLEEGWEALEFVGEEE